MRRFMSLLLPPTPAAAEAPADEADASRSSVLIINSLAQPEASRHFLYQNLCMSVIGHHIVNTVFFGRFFCTSFFRRRIMRGVSSLCAAQTYTNVQIQREREQVWEMRKGRNTKAQGGGEKERGRERDVRAH